MKGERVLLVRHAAVEKPDYGDWLLPAGSVEFGESLEEALKREVNEETGLSVRKIKKLVQHVDPYTKDRLANFLCIPLTSNIGTSSELKEAKWFDVNEIQSLKNIHSGLARFLTEGLRSDAFKE